MSSLPRFEYRVIAYDIPDDKRRTKLLQMLKGFGLHVQFSVFEVKLEPMQLLRLKNEIEKIMDPDEDCVVLYPLNEQLVEKVERLGVVKHQTFDDFLVI